MKCPKCNEEGSLNEVRGKTYYYCRTCKDEIIPPKVEEIDSFQEAIDEEWAKHHKRFFGAYSNLGTITLPNGTITLPNGTITLPNGTITLPNGRIICPLTLKKLT